MTGNGDFLGPLVRVQRTLLSGGEVADTEWQKLKSARCLYFVGNDFVPSALFDASKVLEAAIEGALRDIPIRTRTQVDTCRRALLVNWGVESFPAALNWIADRLSTHSGAEVPSVSTLYNWSTQAQQSASAQAAARTKLVELRGADAAARAGNSAPDVLLLNEYTAPDPIGWPRYPSSTWGAVVARMRRVASASDLSDEHLLAAIRKATFADVVGRYLLTANGPELADSMHAHLNAPWGGILDVDPGGRPDVTASARFTQVRAACLSRVIQLRAFSILSDPHVLEAAIDRSRHPSRKASTIESMHPEIQRRSVDRRISKVEFATLRARADVPIPPAVDDLGFDGSRAIVLAQETRQVSDPRERLAIGRAYVQRRRQAMVSAPEEQMLVSMADLLVDLTFTDLFPDPEAALLRKELLDIRDGQIPVEYASLDQRNEALHWSKLERHRKAIEMLTKAFNKVSASIDGMAGRDRLDTAVDRMRWDETRHQLLLALAGAGTKLLEKEISGIETPASDLPMMVERTIQWLVQTETALERIDDALQRVRYEDWSHISFIGWRIRTRIVILRGAMAARVLIEGQAVAAGTMLGSHLVQLPDLQQRYLELICRPEITSGDVPDIARMGLLLGMLNGGRVPVSDSMNQLLGPVAFLLPPGGGPEEGGSFEKKLDLAAAARWFKSNSEPAGITTFPERQTHSWDYFAGLLPAGEYERWRGWMAGGPVGRASAGTLLREVASAFSSADVDELSNQDTALRPHRKTPGELKPFSLPSAAYVDPPHSSSDPPDSSSSA